MSDYDHELELMAHGLEMAKGGGESKGDQKNQAAKDKSKTGKAPGPPKDQQSPHGPKGGGGKK